MKRLLLSLLLGMAGVLSGTISGADRAYNILFIQSYANNTPYHDVLIEGLKKGLNKEGVKADVTVEYINADYWLYVSERAIMRRICQRARQRGTDLIVTSGDEAFYGLMKCGDSLGYQLPVVVTAIKYPNEELMKSLPNVSGFTVGIDFRKLLDEMKRIFPHRKEVVCLSDSSLLSRRGVKAFESVWPGFQKENPEYTLISNNVQKQSPITAISSVCYNYNAYDCVVVAPKWSPFLSFIGKNSKAPVFTGQNLALTNGVFCAYDAEPLESTLVAGKLAARILSGKTTPSAHGVVNLEGKFLYDYKQLAFFHVDGSVVNKHGIVMNISFSERYMAWLITFYLLVMALPVVLIIRLVRSNRKEARRRIQAQTRLLIQLRLVEQRNELDDIFYSIRDGIISYDSDLRIHFVNRSLRQMLGLPFEGHSVCSYEGQEAGSVFHIYLDGKNILIELLKQVLAQQKAMRIPSNAFMCENQKGLYFPVSGEVVPVFARGRINGVVLICRNISEEERQKRLFRMAMDESSIYPWQFDTHTKRFNISEGLLARLGYPPNRGFMTPEEMQSLIHPDDRESANNSFLDLLHGECTNVHMSFRVKKSEGDYGWWEFRCTIYKGLAIDVPYMVLGVGQSIQRYKDTETALIAARDHALEADKLKSAFLANMSHEIRTPLNAIVGFSDLLKNLDAFTTEEVQDFVELIGVNCSLLLALINDILDLSRIEAGTMDFKFSNYNLTSVMQEIYNSQRMGMPRGVELRVECPVNEDKFIRTDAVRLKQVVNNLINNAKKFTAEGSITLGYTVTEPGYTTVFVEDTGKGISEENKKLIFERFYKVDNFTQGAGLGLSICQTIVTRLGGTISVTSEEGKGTRFEVRLPDEAE
ncbi:PAS domain S-box-containing protein [Bacteroides zoogleoformans]|uniref:histidine kinase n=1 Tax=Bacteroides zoogleoformans TaxID=28119 RepID=A0ABN5IHX6_9BACE|nr:ABC transporter substrate binding protein [Bacteroides zoogleoformans]AVM52321.1 histidine kinase [Bacteroides zoogleoformans]TWJ11208.1 PAS domain S-box-containing protein [Bacteroides zoogleoformans]